MNKKEMLSLIEKVNDYYIDNEKPENGDSGWISGTYFIGCMAAYRMLKKEKYLKCAIKWADNNNWKSRDFVWSSNPTYCIPLYYNNTDNTICTEVYLNLLDMKPDCGTDKYVLEDMKNAVEDKDNDHWKWADLVYMGLPMMNMLGVRLHDERYFDKAYKLYSYAKDVRRLYDYEEQMWLRDETFLPEITLSETGKKIFWGRGNGWVLGGLARTLEFLPDDNKYYDEYSTMLSKMAESVVKWQQPDGMWRSSITEPELFDTPEASGTVLMTYGVAKGIELGVLDKEKYMPYVRKAFNALCDICINEEGRLGYVQGVALKPGPVEKENTQGYAVAAFTLLCETLINIEEAGF